jgi:hypothetical protein
MNKRAITASSIYNYEDLVRKKEKEYLNEKVKQNPNYLEEQKVLIDSINKSWEKVLNKDIREQIKKQLSLRISEFHIKTSKSEHVFYSVDGNNKSINVTNNQKVITIPSFSTAKELIKDILFTYIPCYITNRYSKRLLYLTIQK